MDSPSCVTVTPFRLDSVRSQASRVLGVGITMAMGIIYQQVLTTTLFLLLGILRLKLGYIQLQHRKEVLSHSGGIVALTLLLGCYAKIINCFF